MSDFKVGDTLRHKSWFGSPRVTIMSITKDDYEVKFVKDGRVVLFDKPWVCKFLIKVTKLEKALL